MAIEGKIILKYDRLGFIKYDLDKRISYEVPDYPDFEIGNSITFEIVEKQVKGSDHTYNRAIHLSSIDEKLKSPKPVHDNIIVSRGDIIETDILEFVQPSLIILDFYNGQKALLPIHNLAWNLIDAHKLFNELRVGQRIEVVFLENQDLNFALVSFKHLQPLPTESKRWQSKKAGDFIRGVVIEKLSQKYVLKFTDGDYGLLDNAVKPNLDLGEEIEVQLVSKSFDNYLLNTTLDFGNKSVKQTKVDENKLLDKAFSYPPRDEWLKDKNKFFKSLYFEFCEDSEFNNEKEFFQDSFEKNPNLFDRSFSVNIKLYLRFTFASWESDFKNKLLPFLRSTNPDISDEGALNYLSGQGYWISLNSSQSGANFFTLFNEEIYVSGFVTDEPDERFFLIEKLTIGRKDKSSSYYKEKSQKNGCFLYNSQIQFLKFESNRPIDNDYHQIFDLLSDKSRAFTLYSDLKKRTGAILAEEGESLKIFSNFLQYQEYLAKKKGQERARFVRGPIARLMAKSGELAIKTEVTQDLLEIYESSDTEKVFVSIRTEELSSKIYKRGTELVWFCDAEFEISQGSAIFTLREVDIDTSKLRAGFYVEPKVSLKQWKVQNEIIQDFLNKKIDISHFEAMLVKPDKIDAPIDLDLKFFDPLLQKTKNDSPENNQTKAVNNAVGNKDIFLIQGPPGTGKTTVISEIVNQLLAKNERVLVTSQTHVAVDNVLKKLENLNNKTLVRFGNIKRVMPGLERFHIDNRIDSLSKQYSNIIAVNLQILDIRIEKFGLEPSIINRVIYNKLEELSRTYPENFKSSMLDLNEDFISTTSNVELIDLKNLKSILEGYKNEVATNFENITSRLIYNSLDVAFATCIGVKTDRGINDHNIKFDTVIIDEAGKANLSESIAAVSMGKKVILVGDHKQLPPYMDERLIDDGEPASFTNNSKFNKRNYSLNQIKHALSTSLFEFIINKRNAGKFPDSNIVLLNFQHRMHPNIGQFISESFYDNEVKMGAKTKQNKLKLSMPLDKEVIFFDTSSSKHPYEEYINNSYINKIEAKCISEIIVPILLEEGISSSNFAIISPYRSQVLCISKELKKINISNVDVSTLDSFQGMEYDIIIFSFTRSSPKGKVGFLDDASRLNVAFSRAKKKLILVGNSRTLTDSHSHYDKIYPYTELFQKIVALSKDEKKGRFVDISEYTESQAATKIGELRVGQKVSGRYKTLVKISNGLLHIFILENGLEAAILDNCGQEQYENEQQEDLKITKIDRTNKKINVQSVSKILARDKFKLKFFLEKKVGDHIDCRYSHSITDLGHFFTISDGFQGLYYDPESQANSFRRECRTTLKITKLNARRKQVSLEPIKDE